MNNTVSSLLSSNNEAITAFVNRDLLGKKVSTKFVEELPAVKRIINKQESDGRWVYPSKKPIQRGYDLYYTMKMVGELVQKYGLNKYCKSVKNAANYLFSNQTDEGDFRGIYGNQYSPNYSATIMEFLIMAGFNVDKGLNWLLSVRQSDGGWAIPMRTRGVTNWVKAMSLKESLGTDKSKRFSHFCTGVVLRPFSLVKKYHKEVDAAASLLVNSFFERDYYPDRNGVEYWTRFSFPYQWSDILTGLDALSRMNIIKHPKITRALKWFKSHQLSNGLWKVKRIMGANDKDSDFWINLQIARVLKRF
ncbi:Uncharacterised protein [Candidatus Tiddalikarchaeum anstoanum]|nr:Uncharacterised protein [Candidatus Tiddalikarchaeum anstoanum]